MSKDKAAPSKAGKGKATRPGRDEDVHTCCGCRFPLLVALLQLALGVSITAVAFVMVSFNSSLQVRETPYWAGLMVCLVAIIGFLMLCVSYQPDEKNCIQFAIKDVVLATSLTGFKKELDHLTSGGSCSRGSTDYSMLTKPSVTTGETAKPEEEEL